MLPDPPKVTPLQGEHEADWLIIGAGFAGLAAARRLLDNDPGGKIMVMEAARIADGPAGRNSGFMIDLPHDLTTESYIGGLDKDLARVADNRIAIEFAAAMAAEYHLGTEAFSRTGKVNAAATDAGHAKTLKYAKHLERMGEPFEMLNAAQMRYNTGTSFYQSGLFTPGSAMIQPAMYTRGVAAGLRKAGVLIHENSPVTSMKKKTDWLVRTPDGRIKAKNVILAVNGHLNSFGFMKNRLMHVFTYASMTRPLDAEEVAVLGGESNWGVTPADPMGTTVRRISGTGGNRILVCNRFTFDPSMAIDQRRLNQVALDHDRSFSARFAMLGPMEMSYRWGGRLCLSRNGVSVVRELKERLFAACVQNGQGSVRGTLSGMLAADLACGVRSEALDRALASAAPTRLPPTLLSWLGANAMLRWSEKKAGHEM